MVSCRFIVIVVSLSNLRSSADSLSLLIDCNNCNSAVGCSGKSRLGKVVVEIWP